MDDVGIKIHKLKHLKLHGKMLLADGVGAIVGSINFAAGSLDGRRELAIEVRDATVVDRLHKIAAHDWSIRIRWISRTRGCWPIWTGSRALRSCSPSSTSGQTRTTDRFTYRSAITITSRHACILR